MIANTSGIITAVPISNKLTDISAGFIFIKKSLNIM